MNKRQFLVAGAVGAALPLPARAARTGVRTGPGDVKGVFPPRCAMFCVEQLPRRTQSSASRRGGGFWSTRNEQKRGLTGINKMFMLVGVIRSFADTDTERFYTTGRSRRVPSEIRSRVAMRLTQLDAATRIEDLRLPPSNQLEALKGGRKGQWSIRVNKQWRVCFRFDKGDALDVEFVDYH